jgi:hypothetical protein
MPSLSAPGAPGVSINNTGFLFFVLVAAFIVFITVRGDLPKWLGLLGLAGSPSGSAANTGTNPTAPSNGLPGLPGLPQPGASGSLIASPSSPSLLSDNLTPVNTGYTGPLYEDDTSTF